MDDIREAIAQLEAYPDDSTARQDFLTSIVAFMREHGFSIEAVQLVWKYQERE